MAYDQRTGAGALYRLDPDASLTEVLGGVTISNGLEWSPAGDRAYYADTPTREIAVFDYGEDTGLTGRRTFASVDGLPDGLTVDAEGGVWVAVYGAGCVRRYGPGGGLDAQVDVPTPVTTACTFGGPGLDRLFVTTSQEGLRPGADPLAGSLFAADVGVRGLPVREFAG
jgi:sugar lactone lactonase YvrE